MLEERVLLTGTTSGVGRALLDLYARRGAKVIAVNRRSVPELESSYPRVRFECVDVRSAERVDELLRRLAQSAELPDVFILNAGINDIDNDEFFELARYRAVVDTNLYGVLNFVEPLTRLGRGAGSRHLVAVSSMASYVGNPYGLGYHTSKRALTACFEVWSRMYAGTDLIFQRVMLGPVATTAIYTMHDRLPAWMVRIKQLFSGSLEGTARAIFHFAKTRKRRLIYPQQAVPLYLALWLCQACVPGLFRGRKTLAGEERRPEQSALGRRSERLG
ncbi:MAG TPA: SDR family NAD(P)-dependent oxidoreductase [Polyangiaceae bacterium]|nr:SDR family NAD(P)-dependent oxidoreductase [Polyangiaceae bacterium]